MTTFNKFIVCLSAILVSSFTMAQQTIYVIDFEEAILQSDYSTKRLEELSQSDNFKQLSSEYNSLRADQQALSKEAEGAENWSIEKKKDFQERIQYIRADLELVSKKINAKQQQVFQEIGLAMQEKAKAGLGELIKDEKIGLLLDRKAVLSADPNYDITKKLVAKLNATK